jgi:imidazolonepropionase-like amidohydrolase
MRKLFSILLFFIACSVFAQRTVIYCGQFIDVNNLQVLKEMTVITEANKIVDVVKGYPAAGKTDKVIDLKNKTVMPGLMDMHVHLESETKKGATADSFTMNPPDIALRIGKICERDINGRVYDCA